VLAVDGLFRRFDETLRASGFRAMSGQIVDATNRTRISRIT
jgi:hypothetical protein